MANLPEAPTYDPGVYQYEVTDPVQGGAGGIANTPLTNLANRTTYLKQRLDALINGSIIPPTVAPLNGAAFTGSTTAPNVAPGDDSTLIANTDFVQTAQHGLVTVNLGIISAGGTLTLTQPQWGVAMIEFVGTLFANVSVIFPTQPGNWIVANNTVGTRSVTCRLAAGGPIVIIGPSPNQYNAIWTDGLGVFPQVSPFVLSLTQALVIAALGWTPVQQGGGTNQTNDKINLGYDLANNGHLRWAVNTADQGDIANLSDFVIANGGAGPDAPNNYMFYRSAQGYIVQVYDGITATGADFVTFPNAFPHKCVQVLACEGAPGGWVVSGVISPTIFGTQQLSATSFALYVARFATTWQLAPGITYRYIAHGY